MGAPGPHDFAVRNKCRSSVGTLASTAFPLPTFVTTRTPLFFGSGMHNVEHNFGKDEIDKFLREGLDGPNQLEKLRENRFYAQPLCRLFRVEQAAQAAEN